MRQTWRWFGPRDTVSIDDMLQSGVEGVVSALHHVPTGAVWTADEIDRRIGEIATRADGSASSLRWEIVESLPVSEDIKKQTGEWRAHLDNYRASLRNLAAAGIEVVCYNFMPILDWTRTDLKYRVAHGGTCMRFDLADFAAFDIHILQRAGAATSFSPEIVEEAARRHAGMGEADKARLSDNIVAGLPGAAETMSMDDVRAHLAQYAGIDADRLRSHLFAFLEEVVPVAEEVGIRMCCHPDDPPFPLLGLPRIMSSEADYRQLVEAVDRPANGITLCSGSLGAREDNDLPGMMARLGERVHFLHLRNVRREGTGTPVSFHEAEHLGGDTDMAALIGAVLAEEERRRAAGRADWQIPMRPDHGQEILTDLKGTAQPGYPLVGRMKGLAELRGVAAGIAFARRTA